MIWTLQVEGPPDSARLREISTPEEVVTPSFEGGVWTARVRTGSAAAVLRSRRYGFALVAEELEPGDEAPPPEPPVRHEPEIRAEAPPRTPGSARLALSDWERWQRRRSREPVRGEEVGDLWQRLRGRVGEDLLLDAQAVARSGVWVPGKEHVGVVLVAHGFGADTVRSIEAALDAVVALGSRSSVVVVQNDSRAARAFRAWEPSRHADRYLGIVARNDGFAAACNAGAAALRGARWLLFTQPDAAWGAQAVRDAVGLSLALREQPVGFGRPAVVGPSGGTCDDPYNGTLVEWGRNVYRDRDKPPRPVHWLAGYWLLVDESAFREVGGWNERFFLYYEDPDLSLRLAHAGCRPFAWPGLQVEHARGGTIRSRLEDEVISRIQGESRVTFGSIWGGR